MCSHKLLFGSAIKEPYCRCGSSPLSPSSLIQLTLCYSSACRSPTDVFTMMSSAPPPTHSRGRFPQNKQTWFVALWIHDTDIRKEISPSQVCCWSQQKRRKKRNHRGKRGDRSSHCQVCSPAPLCPITPLPLALSHPSFVHYTPPLYFYFGGDQPTFSSLSLSRRSTVLIKHHLWLSFHSSPPLPSPLSGLVQPAVFSASSREKDTGLRPTAAGATEDRLWSDWRSWTDCESLKTWSQLHFLKHRDMEQ